MSKKLEEIAADAAAEWIKGSTTNHSLANACALCGYNAGFLAGYKTAQEHAHAALESAEIRHEAYVLAAEENFKQMEAKLDQLADASKVMPDTCDHILDATKMVDVNSLNNSKSWISVKNEMPPKDMLVYFYAPKKGFYPNVLFGFWDNDRWYVGGEVRPILSKDVTHWMYIPEPPKEEK